MLNILVATRNRPKDLERLFKSLELQSTKEFRVTVIDSSDILADEVKKTVESYTHMDILFHHTTQRGTCTQRNIGLSLIKDEFVLISDDDCVYAPDAIEHIYRYIAEHPGTAAFGLNIAEERSRFYKFGMFVRRGFGVSNQGRDYVVKRNGINVHGEKNRPDVIVEWIQSCAMVIVKDNITHRELLRFNTDLEKQSGYAAGEDVYFTYNLFLHGYKLGLAHDARVDHLPSPRARDNEKLVYQVRTFNRYLLWRDLIYSRDRKAVFPFIFSNIFLGLQYILGLFKLNPRPFLGHLTGLITILKQVREC